jgi:hypothetical protein
MTSDQGIQQLRVVLVTSAAAVLSTAVLPFLPLPWSASLPYVAASAVIHVAGFLLIGASYRSAGSFEHIT